MTENELLQFLKEINKDINLRQEDGLTHLYYKDRCMGIGIAGALTNGTEYTYQTLRTEVNVFFKERMTVKLKPKVLETPKKRPRPREKF